MLTLEKFEEASEVVKQVTTPTKLVYSEYLSAQTGARIYLKPENMQHTGAYKLRGAYYNICRKSCAGCGICGKTLWMQSNDRNADRNSSD